MRMWNVDPSFMCRKHLLGEHVEMHMFLGCIKKDKNILGYIERGLVEVCFIYFRHNELVREMKRRGYNHKSDMTLDDRNLTLFYRHRKGINGGTVDVDKNIKELSNRCDECGIIVR